MAKILFLRSALKYYGTMADKGTIGMVRWTHRRAVAKKKKLLSFNPLVPSADKSVRIVKISILKLDVDPQRDDDASPMSTYRCMLRPT